MMTIFFGIGTNLGDREANLRRALSYLDARVGERLACSPVYRSAPQGFVSDNEFANLVVAYRTMYSLEELLFITQSIERDMGRTHKSVGGHYSDRVIDIDLLEAYEDVDGVCCALCCSTSTLTVPHPLISERAFVTIPLRQVKDLLRF